MIKKGLFLAFCLFLVLGMVGCSAPKAPVLDVQEGTYDRELSAKIVNLDEGELAYYSLDGTEPNQDSTAYTQDGIPLFEGATQVKVIKLNSQGKSSPVLTAQYVISPQLPQLATPDGLYNATFSAQVINLQEGQRCYYTLDGSPPDKNSTLYTDVGIPLQEGENQVKLIKYDEYGNSGDILTAYLDIEPHESDYSNSLTKLHKVGDIIYYVQNYSGFLHSDFPEFTRLYSYNLSNGTTRIVLDSNMNRFIIRNSNIYYEYQDEDQNYHWCWASLDGSSHGTLMKTDEETFVDYHPFSIMVDDWIYYGYSETGRMNLHRINVNTLETEQVSQEEGIGGPSVVGRDILYTSQGKLYRLEGNTAETTLIATEIGYSYKLFGEHIYSYAQEPEQRVFRMGLDGTQREQVPGARSNEFVIVGDRVYYGMPDGIHSIRIDGKDHQLLSDNVPNKLQYYRGKLYYYSGEHNHSVYSLDLASNEESLLLEAESSDPNWYFIDGQVYYIYTSPGQGRAGLYHLTELGLETLATE